MASTTAVASVGPGGRPRPPARRRAGLPWPQAISAGCAALPPPRAPRRGRRRWDHRPRARGCRQQGAQPAAQGARAQGAMYMLVTAVLIVAAGAGALNAVEIQYVLLARRTCASFGMENVRSKNECEEAATKLRSGLGDKLNCTGASSTATNARDPTIENSTFPPFCTLRSDGKLFFSGSGSGTPTPSTTFTGNVTDLRLDVECGARKKGKPGQADLLYRCICARKKKLPGCGNEPTTNVGCTKPLAYGCKYMYNPSKGVCTACTADRARYLQPTRNKDCFGRSAVWCPSYFDGPRTYKNDAPQVTISRRRSGAWSFAMLGIE